MWKGGDAGKSEGKLGWRWSNVIYTHEIPRIERSIPHSLSPKRNTRGLSGKKKSDLI